MNTAARVVQEIVERVDREHGDDLRACVVVCVDNDDKATVGMATQDTTDPEDVMRQALAAVVESAGGTITFLDMGQS